MKGDPFRVSETVLSVGQFSVISPDFWSSRERPFCFPFYTLGEIELERECDNAIMKIHAD